MRGYFGIGVERISKAWNVGNLFRSAHAFGASFVFTINAEYKRSVGIQSDTSDTLGQLPFYSFPNIDNLILPENCSLVGIEFTENAIELPSFHHPNCATYVMGPERGSLSKDLSEKCDHIVRIPTKFCLNVGIAGAIIMYDRLKSIGRFAAKPTRPGGPIISSKNHKHGKPKFRKKITEYKITPPFVRNDFDS